MTFLFPQLRDSYKSTIMPYHIFFGLLGYAMAVVAALLGLSEKAFFHMLVKTVIKTVLTLLTNIILSTGKTYPICPTRESLSTLLVC